jgi:hypothetical protein
VLFYVGPYPVGVCEETDLEDAFEVSAGDRGEDGPRAGRDDEPVVGVFERPPRLQVENGELLARSVYPLHPVADLDLDVLLRELLGGAGDEVVAPIDDARKEIGQAALADRRFRLLLVDRDLHLRVKPARPRRRLRPRRHATNDHKPHIRESFRFGPIATRQVYRFGLPEEFVAPSCSTEEPPVSIPGAPTSLCCLVPATP